MEGTKYLYAAIGAPVVIAKQARHRFDDVRTHLGERTSKLTDEARRQIDAWAAEGEDVFGKISESETIDELTSKMDLDQVQEQVSKLREQLEDLLATWRTNFRPESSVTSDETATTEKAPAAEKPAPAKKPAAEKKPATAKKPAAKKPATQKPAAEKKPAAKAS